MSITSFHRALNTPDDDPLLSALRQICEAKQPLQPIRTTIWDIWA